MKPGYTYILTNKRNGTLYIGVTSDLIKRIHEHKEKLAPGFTKTHNLTQLAYYEIHPDIETAILREKQMKEWKRVWKLKRIETQNLDWQDLYPTLL